MRTAIDGLETRAIEQITFDLQIVMILGRPGAPSLEKCAVLFQSETIKTFAEFGVTGDTDGGE